MAITSEGRNRHPASQLYTAHNIWYEEPANLYAINYKLGTMIPAGTKVASAEARRGCVTFRLNNDRRVYTMQIIPKYQPKLCPKDLLSRCFTPKDFDALTAGLNAREIEMIRAGQIEDGMSKQAILIAYGYPPTHRTPSIKNNTWYYWHNRFSSLALT
ncbi:MAG: hypothetical protein JXN60_04895, partial [Lentisphaerae bacterium]|nr:hypothetical protein [Lentisphaerota bacterium]